MADARKKGKMVAAASSAYSSSDSKNYVRFAADRHTAFLVDNHSNFRKSAEPDLVMFYDADEMWANYPVEILKLAKGCFKDKIPATEVTISGRNVLLDFYRMVEVDFESGFERSIAWMDVAGTYWFPKNFVNSGIAVDKIKEVIEDGEVTAKRRRHEGPGDNPEVVDNVGPGRYDVCLARWPGTSVLVEKLDDEYQFAKTIFLDGLGAAAIKSVTVTRIHLCVKEGPARSHRDAAFKRLSAAVSRKRGGDNVSIAWYGASTATIRRFLATGYLLPEDLNLSSPRGVGVYFSPGSLSRYSTLFAERDEGGEKHVVLCQVVLGETEKVTDPNQVFPSSSAFDTGVDDVENPKWHVVWPADMNTHISPEAVISFRGDSDAFPDLPRNSAGSVLPSTFGDYAVVVSKVGKSLPAAPARDLQRLFGLWKNGNIGEQVFMRRLRGFVDEGRLGDMLEEIRRIRSRAAA